MVPTAYCYRGSPEPHLRQRPDRPLPDIQPRAANQNHPLQISWFYSSRRSVSSNSSGGNGATHVGGSWLPTDGRTYALLFPTLKGVGDGQGNLECANHVDRLGR